MANAAILYDNLFDAASVVASSFVIATPPAILQDKHVARKLRFTGNDEYVVADLGALASIDTLGLLGLNLTAAGITRARISSADSSGASGDVYDSGSLTGQADPNYQALITLLAAPVIGRYVRWDVADASLDFIEAGRGIVGPRHAFTTNFAYNWSRSYTDLSRKSKGPGGQTFVMTDVSYRTLSTTFECVSQTERDGLVETIARDNGAHSDVFFITDPETSNPGRDCVWGLLIDSGEVTQPGFDYFNKSYKVEQRL